jgi:hypothetical protein
VLAGSAAADVIASSEMIAPSGKTAATAWHTFAAVS